jgi:hypothetical protein
MTVFDIGDTRFRAFQLGSGQRPTDKEPAPDAMHGVRKEDGSKRRSASWP